MSLAQSPELLGNRLLAALPTDVFQQLQPHLTLVALSLQQVIYEAGDLITEVYFPRSAIISLVATLEDGSTMEMGMVGQEGMAGMPVLLGGMTKAHRAFVQIAGEAWRLKATVLKAEFDRGGALQKLLLRYFSGIVYPGGADRRLQSVSPYRRTACPLAAAGGRLPSLRQISTDARIYRSNDWRASIGCHGGSGCAQSSWLDSLHSRSNYHYRSPGVRSFFL